MKVSPVRVSVITACYNSATTISETLWSVASQTHEDVEHIVINGASNDGTLDVIREYGMHVAKLVSEPDKGIYDALNKGLSCATGDLVGFLHSDDFFAHNGVLERVAEAFTDPAVDAVYGDLDYVSKSDHSKIVRRWRAGSYSPNKLAWGWMPPHPTFYTRRETYIRWGGFDTSLRIAADYDLMLRFLSNANMRLVYIPEVLVKMRVGGTSNRSLSHMLRKSREDYEALRRNQIGGLGTLCWKNLSKLGQFV